MPLSWNEIRDRAVEFVRDWKDESSEHAEAKSFWDAFFQVFGVSRRRMASFEAHVKKANGGDGYIDLFWPGMLLAEHKSLGKNLDSAFDQAIDYFPGLTDKELPRYIIVSDFARLRLRNLDTGENIEFELADLPKHLNLFGFIAGYETRAYKEQDPVNVKAAERLATLHDALRTVGYEGHELEVYLVRILFCLFADDTGVFMPRSAFEEFIRTRTSEDGSDLAPRLHQLFQVLNTPVEKRLRNLDEQVASFPYINGKLFEEPLSQASFDRAMRDILLECCDLDWGAISPAIFGSLFQGIMNEKVRRNLGAHYTSEKNILKLIGPLFLDELRAEFEQIRTQPVKLRQFHDKLATLNFFDPACGCGNFLIISYRELRLLELEVINALHAKEKQQLSIDAIYNYVKVNVDQFHGIEIEEWPAQIARVAMWLIDHQMNLLVGQTFGQTLIRIPLVKSANIVHANALECDWETVVPTSKCSFVLGNPPFVGTKLMGPDQRKEADAVFSGISGAGILDYVAAWYVKAARYLSINAKCAFVSTNSICQGEQVAPLWGWMLAQGIALHFAHRTFRWSNEAKGVAAVHCIIVGFGKTDGTNKRIFDYSDVRDDEPHIIKANNINPYLVDAPDVLIQRRTKPLCDVPKITKGNQPTDGGNLIISKAEKDAFLNEHPEASGLIKRLLGAKEFLQGSERYCLWLVGVKPSTIKSYKFIYDRVEACRNWRQNEGVASDTIALAATPTLFRETRNPESFVILPSVSSERRTYIPFGFEGSDTIATNLCLVIDGASLFHYGVIQSAMHMAWVRTVCGRMKSDYRYSKDIVYNNFPWPVAATDKQRESISQAAQGVLDARAQFPDSTLADLYDPLTMPPALVKAHQALDKAVDAAYVPSGGKRSWPTEAERVAFLFELYQRLTS